MSQESHTWKFPPTSEFNSWLYQTIAYSWNCYLRPLFVTLFCVIMTFFSGHTLEAVCCTNTPSYRFSPHGRQILPDWVAHAVFPMSTTMNGLVLLKDRLTHPTQTILVYITDYKWRMPFSCHLDKKGSKEIRKKGDHQRRQNISYLVKWHIEIWFCDGTTVHILYIRCR